MTSIVTMKARSCSRGSEEIADEELYVNDRNDEHCGLSLSGSASERL